MTKNLYYHEQLAQWGPVIANKSREERLEDFALFVRYQMECRASDAEYPLLRTWYAKKHYDRESAIWRSIVFVGFCNLHSMYEFCDRYPEPVREYEGRVCFLPSGVERRGHRGGRITRHLTDWYLFLQKYGSFQNFLQKGFTGNKKRDWHILQNNIVEVWGNGRWAGYKLAETLYSVHDYPVEPTDMGNAHSSGPRRGLTLLFDYVRGNTKEAIAVLDYQAAFLMYELQKRGLNPGIEKAETMLCDYHGMAVGHCYPGHDLDLYQEQLLQCSLQPEQKAFFWEVRREAIPNEFLGELHGWVGIEKERHKIYQRTGKVLRRTEPIERAYCHGFSRSL